MTQEIKIDNYRGVLCRYCRQPIPVPSIVNTLEAQAKEANPGGDAGQVFTLRCRSCDGEHPYRSSEIANFEGNPKPRVSRIRLMRGQSKLSRAANA